MFGTLAFRYPILVSLFRRFVTVVASRDPGAWLAVALAHQCHRAGHAQLSQAVITYGRHAFVLYGIRQTFKR